MLTVRRVSGLAGFRLILVPEVDQRGVVVLLLAGPGRELAPHGTQLRARAVARDRPRPTDRRQVGPADLRPRSRRVDDHTGCPISAVGDVVLALAPLDGALLAIDG